MKLRTFLTSIFTAFFGIVAVFCILIPNIVGTPGLISTIFGSLFDFSAPIGVYATIVLILSVLLVIAALVPIIMKKKWVYIVSAVEIFIMTLLLVFFAKVFVNMIQGVAPLSFDLAGFIFYIISFVGVIVTLVFIYLDLLFAKEKQMGYAGEIEENHEDKKVEEPKEESENEVKEDNIKEDKVVEEKEPVMAETKEEKAEEKEEPKKEPKKQAATKTATKKPIKKATAKKKVPAAAKKPAPKKKAPAKASKTDPTKVYHVNKRADDGKWTIKFANGEKVIKLCDTKDEAVAFANELAKNQEGTVLVHASKGKNKGKIQKQ